MRVVFSLISAIVLIGSTFGSAPEVRASESEGTRVGDIEIQSPWARASAGQAKNGAAYLIIVNHGADPDRLVSVSTSQAKKAELHTHLHEDGVMKMRQIEGVEVDPGGTAQLKPGADHVMLMGLNAPLVEGESFALELVFEKAGTVEIMVSIAGVAAGEAPMTHDHGDMSHGGMGHAMPTVIQVHRISAEGVGPLIGTIEAMQGEHGVMLKPDLSGLSPGLHAFHVHTNPDCGPALKGGKMVAGLAAGGHYDPTGTGHSHGHAPAGDLPQLDVGSDGRATKPIEITSLTLEQLRGRALMVHQGPEEPSDPGQPKGGGPRVACGVVK